jgi:actin-related protein
MALLANNRVTGLVVDVSDTDIDVVPVYQG